MQLLDCLLMERMLNSLTSGNYPQEGNWRREIPRQG